MEGARAAGGALNGARQPVREAFVVWAAIIGALGVLELIGQSLALMFVPKRIIAYAIAFLLFRGFDIWKPLGAREVQRLPGGVGVVADDVIAGITACLAFHAGHAVLVRLAAH